MEREKDTRTIEELLAAGDERCMTLLFERYYQPLCAYAARYPLSMPEVEDIVQEVFISFWENKRGRPFTGSVRSYLFGAVGKAALQWIRDEGKVYFEDVEAHSDDFWEDKSYKEVAEEMGISVNSVKTYYLRALLALRKMLDPKSLLLLVALLKRKI